MPTPFSKNVFINCPFDKEYRPLLRTLIFTVYYLGFYPRLALERSDSGEQRIDKINKLIIQSKFSIHDLSRIKSKSENEYSRMNMPFEIGLDMGLRSYHPNVKYREKKFLILESEKYSYQRALSDLSGIDPKCHNEDPEELTMQVRNWFSEIGYTSIPAGSKVWDDYNVFQADLYEKMMTYGFNKRDIDNMPIPEFIKYIEKWICKRL